LPIAKIHCLFIFLLYAEGPERNSTFPTAMKFAPQLFLCVALIFPGVSQELPEASSHQKMVQALQIIEESA